MAVEFGLAVLPLAYHYGAKLAKKECDDHLGMGKACEAKVQAIHCACTAGYLVKSRACGFDFLTPALCKPGEDGHSGGQLATVELATVESVAANTEEAWIHEANQALANFGSQQVVAPIESTGGSTDQAVLHGSYQALPIIYATKSVGDRVIIPKDQIPGFLLDNGIQIMNAKQLEHRLKAHLSKTMALIECDCVAKYSILGKTEVTSMCERAGTNLSPGDVKLRLRMRQDFKLYKEDPSAYEDMLKAEILNAIGLDAKKLPNAKRDIKIEEVKEGSIIVTLIIGGVLLAAAGFALFAGYWNNRTPSPAPLPTTPVHPALAPPPTAPLPPPTAHQPEDTTLPSQNQQQHGLSDGSQRQWPLSNSSQSCMSLTVLTRRGDCQAESYSALPELSANTHARQDTHSVSPRATPGAASSQGEIGRTASAMLPTPDELVRRPVLEAHFINEPDDKTWSIVVYVSVPIFFLKESLFQTSLKCYTNAGDLKENETVISAADKKLTVVSKQIYGCPMRNLVTLRTPQSELTVLADHRVIVQGADGILTEERQASQLKVGDMILCGAKPQKLCKVRQFKAWDVDIVELRFSPGDPVQTFQALRWGILSNGQRSGSRVSAFNPGFKGPLRAPCSTESRSLRRSPSF